MDFITKIIGAELKIFEKKFAEAVKSETLLLDTIMKYIIKSKGKQLRPMFVLLSAKLHGEINESTYRAAALVELLHTATLVHDDVVDDALERRSFFSINALWNKKIAVLVGDYLLSKGLLLATSNNDFRHLHILSDAVKQMSEGELLQLQKTRKLNLNEEITHKMKLFGEKVGIAFQIKDDLFDYGKDDVGKPTGNDIKEKKLTLPLIYTLNNIDNSLKRKLIYIIKNENQDPQKVKFVIDVVTKTGGIKYASEKMNVYRDDALEILNSFPENPVRKAMEELVRFTTDRKY